MSRNSICVLLLGSTFFGSTVACHAPDESRQGSGGSGSDAADDGSDVDPGGPAGGVGSSGVGSDEVELCDGLDNDGDGQVDEDAEDARVWFADVDGDGFGDAANSTRSCVAPDGFVDEGGDCDDLDLGAFPGATERCDGIDSNCDGDATDAGTATFVDADGNGTDLTALLSGTESEPALLTLEEEGVVNLCAGHWYATVDLRAQVDILGQGADASEIVIDAAGSGSVIQLRGAGLDVVVSGLSLTGGEAEEGPDRNYAGGAVQCAPRHGSTALTLEEVLLFNNHSEWYGGGVAAFNCELTISDSTIEDNVAQLGGGMFVSDGDSAISLTSIRGNTGEQAGGGIALTEDGSAAELLLSDTVVESNRSSIGGGVYEAAGAVRCETSSGSVSGGVFGNRDDFGADGVYLANDATFVADECDFEGDVGAEDGFFSDVYAEGGDFAYLYGEDQSFACDVERCGTMSALEVGGGDEESEGADSDLSGNVFTASVEGTIETWSVYLLPSSASCTLTQAVLSASSPSDPVWLVEWTDSAVVGATTERWYTVGNVGLPVIVGRTYALVSAWDCPERERVTSYSEDLGVTSMDAGLGTTIGSWASSWDAADLADGEVDGGVGAHVGASHPERRWQLIQWSH